MLLELIRSLQIVLKTCSVYPALFSHIVAQQVTPQVTSFALAYRLGIEAPLVNNNSLNDNTNNNTFICKAICMYFKMQSTKQKITTQKISRLNYSGAKKVFSQPPIVQVFPLKKMREACNFHHRYTSTMADKMRRKIQKITLQDF